MSEDAYLRVGQYCMGDSNARLAAVVVAASEFLALAVDRGWVLPDGEVETADEDDRAGQALRDALYAARNP